MSITRTQVFSENIQNLWVTERHALLPLPSCTYSQWIKHPVIKQELKKWGSSCKANTCCPSWELVPLALLWWQSRKEL